MIAAERMVIFLQNRKLAELEKDVGNHIAFLSGKTLYKVEPMVGQPLESQILGTTPRL